MDIPAVQDIAKTFNQVSEVLKGVVTALDVLINVLNTTAFMGAVGGAAVAHFMEIMKRQIDDVADRTEEVSNDVNAAVEAYQRGDAQGSTKFH
jgi:methyl-accepting chemotaxis protein